MELNLNNKKAIITGASRGIGKAIAVSLAKEGVNLSICSRNLESIKNTAQEISSVFGVKVNYSATDTLNTEEVKNFINKSADFLGGIEIVVNNAAAPGGLVMGPLETASESDLIQDIDTKVVGYLRVSKYSAPYLIKSGWGRIINIGGLAARSGGALSGMRNLALTHMTKTLSSELGPKGINVNIIHPGITVTEATEPKLTQQAKDEGVTLKEIETRASQGLDTRKVPTADDIAVVATFLASPLSSSIAGEAIAAGGGVGSAVFM